MTRAIKAMVLAEANDDAEAFVRFYVDHVQGWQVEAARAILVPAAMLGRDRKPEASAAMPELFGPLDVVQAPENAGQLVGLPMTVYEIDGPTLAAMVGDNCCIYCGCRDLAACWHPEHGACWWAEPGVCSHCKFGWGRG